jgi:hypothetical protein
LRRVVRLKHMPGSVIMFVYDEERNVYGDTVDFNKVPLQPLAICQN